jgi:beta-alanine--pyruvate transaminase
MAAAGQNLEPYWMPFTGNRYFKSHPLMVESASGMYYRSSDGREILDAIAGLWCCNAGHCHPRITEAIRDQAGRLDYATAFQFGHPGVFELAERLTGMAPEGLDYAFFTNSGSESVDTALKIALAYQRHRGEAQRTRLIGRQRGYHGVGFGGISVGGISPNRRLYSASLIPGVDHLPDTHAPAHNRFSRGQPAWGAQLADELEAILALHDPSTVAAVIVEPVAGSAGVLVPPVQYLDRLREICDRHDILLIFDEVITAFGRVGRAFAADKLGVRPDIATVAKGLTNGAVPMGAVLVDRKIYQAFMQGPEQGIEFFHGYTYSGHPLATAAALATLDVYAEEGLFERAAALAPAFEDALHGLADAPHVIDVRNFGLMGAVEVEPRADGPTLRALDIYRYCFEHGLIVRTTSDIVALTPALIISEEQIAQIVEILGSALRCVD